MDSALGNSLDTTHSVSERMAGRAGLGLAKRCIEWGVQISAQVGAVRVPCSNLLVQLLCIDNYMPGQHHGKPSEPGRPPRVLSTFIGHRRKLTT